MAGKRRRFTAEFKARGVRGALREDKTPAAWAGQFGVPANQIAEGRRQAPAAMPDVLGRKRQADGEGRGRLPAGLRDSGRGPAVRAGRHAPGGTGVDEKRARPLGMDDAGQADEGRRGREHPGVRPCEWLPISRGRWYDRPVRDEEAQAFACRMLHVMDERYTARPHPGRYGLADALAPECRIQVNPKRMRRLMKMLGLEAAYPRPRSPARQAHARWAE